MKEIKLPTKFICGAGLTHILQDYLIMEGLKEVVGTTPKIFFESGEGHWATLSDDYIWALEYQDRKDAFDDNNKDPYYLGKPVWR